MREVKHESRAVTRAGSVDAGRVGVNKKLLRDGGIRISLKSRRA
jgi:hypothetical protein